VGVILMVAGTVSLAICVTWAFRPDRPRAEAKTDGGRLKTLGKVPSAPRWHTGDAATHAVPFDAHQTSDLMPSPIVAPDVAAPWYDSDTDPYHPYAQPGTEIADTADEPAPRWRNPET
jgi:hypothetical protein